MLSSIFKRVFRNTINFFGSMRPIKEKIMKLSVTLSRFSHISTSFVGYEQFMGFCPVFTWKVLLLGSEVSDAVCQIRGRP